MRVLRVYHGGRSQAHRARERALVAAGVDVTLVVPAQWTEPEAETSPLARGASRSSSCRCGGRVTSIATPTRTRVRSRRVVREVAPDLLDVHEEPFSVAARQWLAAAPREPPDRHVHGSERRQALPSSVRPVRDRRAPARRRPVSVQQAGGVGRPGQGLRGADRGAAARVRRRDLLSGRPVAGRRRDRARPLRPSGAREGCRRRGRDSRAREQSASRTARRRRQRSRSSRWREPVRQRLGSPIVSNCSPGDPRRSSPTSTAGHTSRSFRAAQRRRGWSSSGE